MSIRIVKGFLLFASATIGLLGLGVGCGEEAGSEPVPDSGTACAEGQYRCLGDVLQRCDGDTWQDNTDCVAQGKVCVSEKGCTEEADAGTDTDAGSDTDGDADADSDSDTDGDSDGDSDADTDGDADGDADSDGDGDGDTDVATDTGTEEDNGYYCPTGDGQCSCLPFSGGSPNTCEGEWVCCVYMTAIDQCYCYSDDWTSGTPPYDTAEGMCGLYLQNPENYSVDACPPE